MIFWNTFIQSLQLPKKQIVFRLNRTGMDITVIYMFLLLFIASIPSLIDRITTSTGPGSDMNLVFLIIYFFMFYYLPLTIAIFLIITLIAYIGSLVAKLLHRKLKLQVLWKMTAYTSTIPVLIYTVIAFYTPVNNYYILFVAIFITVMLSRIITIYPKRKKRKQ
ncbi:DUF1189 family protein [Ornithinibacillus halophilus]|uniref:DUF1189 domain-containing protein n=1 Tax=Ornithinibacillus halophilus TaxID=930117 RepID=A0A1M5G0V2_9BACI|nr:DUF1189 family protein [Ornithinibacillus halophilus]SHF97091.1 Protein of unknown function [Ornithinibacillus halophilus]